MFLVSHQDDKYPDDYQPCEKARVSFTFRQRGGDAFNTTFPARFTVALCTETDQSKLVAAILSASQPYQVKQAAGKR